MVSAPATRRAARSIRLLAGLALAACGLAGSLRASAEGSDAERTRFRQAYATAQQGGDAWRAQAAGLEHYVLFPYLEAASLEHDLRTLDRARVDAYLAANPGLIPAADLRRDFLNELARRKDWVTFTAMYQPGLGDGLSCFALQAKLSRGQPLVFETDLADLWKKASLPNACDPVLSAAHDQGLLTPDRLWTRIQTAADAGKGGTVAGLAAWLPPEDAAAAQRIAQALNDPTSALRDAATWPDTPRHRQAVTLALQRMARKQSTVADSAWTSLAPRFSLSEQQKGAVLNALALFHATDFDESALDRLVALPPGAQTDATREWRVRVALARQDWPAALAAIDALAPAQKDDGEWRYFRALVLAKLGRQGEAKAIYQNVAQEATYFGFLAADRIDASYAICPATMATDERREAALLTEPGVDRAFELYAVGLQKYARREWTAALAGRDADTQRLAADLAFRKGWYDRGVFGLSSGEALRLYEQRFPLARQDGVVEQASQAGIEAPWAYAIIRAESAWMTDARSGADARGLMQLLPGTASLVARRNGLAWSGGDSLYEPTTNIILGTRYLSQMAARYNGAPWLASAAYNAGPNKVDQWVSARGSLDPDLFVASIPYKETREYVARVMAFAVIYDWRLTGNALPIGSRMTRIGSTYALPAPGAVRKPVSCPAPSVARPAPPTAPAVTQPAPAEATSAPAPQEPQS
ncbi:MAG: transglycosylase SLT domain-containing protein [Luteibacter sp.]|uniref:transglycosylase SLT domain-containing protein n=1 Tax=Luteibacter sp. TaxID=1886636 RepID=UPI00280699DC|nr:transglycosylase SLT domain-containing protein [Luteibacter sp.]MDQ7996617.1 transglycosylase SLT domain-containing protein [Luteibacter sp.]MDQ8048404.1 transglycosylase SLT domain-containing protein [Luteibacter sp.]